MFGPPAHRIEAKDGPGGGDVSACEACDGEPFADWFWWSSRILVRRWRPDSVV